MARRGRVRRGAACAFAGDGQRVQRGLGVGEAVGSLLLRLGVRRLHEGKVWQLKEGVNGGKATAVQRRELSHADQGASGALAFVS